MRPLKYKAYLKDYNKIVDVDRLGLNWDGSVQEIIVSTKELEGKDEWTDFQAGQFELMEFINLYDKKGIEIYTGNIVRIVTTQTNDKRIGEVIYYKGNAMYLVETTMEDYFTFMYADITEVEIIGNIFQNRDLLSK
ncbi:YopX family protein [Campylobacter concisus]